MEVFRTFEFCGHTEIQIYTHKQPWPSQYCIYMVQQRPLVVEFHS